MVTLTISAAKGLDKDEQEKETGTLYPPANVTQVPASRSFYVGEDSRPSRTLRQNSSMVS